MLNLLREGVRVGVIKFIGAGIAVLVFSVLVAVLYLGDSSADGKVVGVLDGDTLEVMQNGRAVRVRLAEVDCPEKSQPYGARAKQFTSKLAFGQQVKLVVRDHDRYGRTVAEVILPDGQSLNRELVRAGYAWWYRQYSHDATLGKLESEARSGRLGLWSDPRPVPPWEWRKDKRTRGRHQKRVEPDEEESKGDTSSRSGIPAAYSERADG
jgi:micrococcal nuclease